MRCMPSDWQGRSSAAKLNVGKTFSDKAVELIFRTAHERESATVCNACGAGNIPKQTATYNYQNR